MIPLRRSPQGFPMAPSQEEWDALTPEERAEVVAALPGDPENQSAIRAVLRAADERIAELGRQLDELMRPDVEAAMLLVETARRQAAEAEVAKLREQIARLERER